MGQSRELLAGFELEESQPLWGSADPPRESGGTRPGDGSGGRRSRMRARAATAQRRACPLVCPGRGTFWRAFASSSSWGEERSRGFILPRKSAWAAGLVAIKVSRPDGNEPQILARLQHTHIVPVHSVCDDPDERPARAVHALFRRGESRSGARGLRRSDPDQPRRPQPRPGSRRGQPRRHLAIQKGPGRVGIGQAATEPARSDQAEKPVLVSRSRIDGRSESQAASRFRSLFSRWVEPECCLARDARRTRSRPRPAVAAVSARSLGDSGRCLDRGPAGGRSRPRPLAGTAPSRPEAREYSAGERRNAHAS